MAPIANPEYDLIVREGTIVDGSGLPAFRADLAVKDGKIVMISGRIGARAVEELGRIGVHRGPLAR